MKALTIEWLNKCRCGNKSHTVKTARGNESALWDDDAVKCNSCGRGGVIQVCEGQARVLWETDEEMAENKPMSTITKERIEQLANGNNICKVTREERIELARIALASLEAEPLGYIDAEYAELLKSGHIESCSVYAEQGEGCITLYIAPPAPVSVPDDLYQFAEFMAAESIKSGDYPDGWQCKASNAAHEYAQSCRAAMLQGAENAESPTTMQAAPALDSSPKIAESPSGNSPVIPDGWVMVPVELTGAMTNAMTDAILDDLHNVDVWRSVLAAAPQ